MDITADMLRRQNEICETAFAQRTDGPTAVTWWMLQVEIYNDLASRQKNDEIATAEALAVANA